MKLNNAAEIQVVYSSTSKNTPTINNSRDAFNYIRQFFNANTIGLQEEFIVCYLNRSSKVLGVFHLSKGGITGTVVDVRLILAIALKIAAVGLILSHNHPSGSLKPSNPDIELTNKIKESCKVMDLLLIDHIIVSSSDEYLSFGDEGLI